MWSSVDPAAVSSAVVVRIVDAVAVVDADASSRTGEQVVHHRRGVLGGRSVFVVVVAAARLLVAACFHATKSTPPHE